MMMRRLHRTLIAAVAASLAAGCGTLAPSYEQPAAPVAPSYPGDAAVAVPGAQRPAALEWRAFFTDPALQRLIDAALRNNRDLRIAVANVEQARAQVQVRRADLLPSVGVGVSANRQPTASGDANTVYSAGLQVTSYELDLFGRVASLRDAALAQFFATEANRKTAQITLVRSVASLYLALLADEDLLELTRQTLRTREESLRLTRLKFDQGVSSELDLRQAQSLVEGARATLAQQRRQRALDENALVLVLGAPNVLEPVAAGALAQTTLGPELPAGLPSDLLTERPDIRAAEQQLIAANANIGAARSAFFPRITLTGSAGSASTELSGLFSSGSFGWTFVGQLLQPIFDAGRNRGNLDAANAARDVAVAQYERAIQSAFREVADALAGRETLQEQLRAQSAQAEAETARYRLSDLRYRNGASSYLDVLDAQRALFTAQQAAILAKLAVLQNQVSLYAALGGGQAVERY